VRSNGRSLGKQGAYKLALHCSFTAARPLGMCEPGGSRHGIKLYLIRLAERTPECKIGVVYIAVWNKENLSPQEWYIYIVHQLRSMLHISEFSPSSHYWLRENLFPRDMYHPSGTTNRHAQGVVNCFSMYGPYAPTRRTKPKNAPQVRQMIMCPQKIHWISHFETNQRLKITLHDLVTINGSERWKFSRE